LNGVTVFFLHEFVSKELKFLKFRGCRNFSYGATCLGNNHSSTYATNIVILSKEHKTGSVDGSHGKDHKRLQEMPEN